ncbi:hypothetical protein B0T25DRAFT_96182 [Lasiosphaeria hispida]|uniref:Uncharacterized protein n=1 Tax=Lasiosphaeria hispida TaxID=260671 RepID=A0AAJ0MHK7_9PEZI|nr:hypothetical protein B0T25DRAFT_96182 [Lasiosphaeria hispida]
MRRSPLPSCTHGTNLWVFFRSGLCLRESRSRVELGDPVGKAETGTEPADLWIAQRGFGFGNVICFCIVILGLSLAVTARMLWLLLVGVVILCSARGLWIVDLQCPSMVSRRTVGTDLLAMIASDLGWRGVHRLLCI